MDPEDIDWKEEDEDEENDERWSEPVALLLEPRHDGLGEVSHSSNIEDDGKPGVSTLGKSSNSIMSRMALNDNKAGMDGLDKERINKIIHEASKGSRFYENEHKKEAQVNLRIDRMMQQLAGITPQQKAAALVEVDAMVVELEATRDFSRSIVHLDMDAFYAAVEMRDNPSLKDKPMAVGSASMLCTSNYHARRYGVRAAMPGFIGKKLCPELIMVPTNFDKYRTVSTQVREILGEYDPNFCPMSLDEAYFDLTEHLDRRREFTEAKRTFDYGDWKNQADSEDSGGSTQRPGEISEQDLSQESEADDEEIWLSNRKQIDDSSSTTVASDPSCAVLGASETESSSHGAVGAVSSGKRSRTFGFTVEEVVEEIRFRIEQKTQLTASAGIAPNIMLAKICSDKNKPNGQYRIQPNREAVMEFIRVLPIRKVSGIGKVTERMLSALGVQNCTDLYQQRVLLHLLFSQISSHHFLRISLGLGSTRVERDSERKSMSTERTFRELHKPADLYGKCSELCQALAEDLQNEELMGKTVTIKLKTVKFEVKTKACSVPTAIYSADCIFNVAKDLLRAEINACKPERLRLRLMGVRLSNLQPNSGASNKQGSITEFFKKRQTPAPPSQQLIEAQQETGSGCEQSRPQNTTVDFLAESLHEREMSEMVVTVPLDSEPQPSTSEPPTEIPVHHAHPSDQNFCLPLDDQVTIDSMTEENHGRDLEDNSVDAVGTSEFLCPVCYVLQPCANLEAFNEHVDVCLNRGAIRDMLKQQAADDIPTARQSSTSPAKGKRSSSGPKSAPKRRKQERTKTATLDKFFN